MAERFQRDSECLGYGLARWTANLLTMKTVRFNDALENARKLLATSEIVRKKGPENFVLIRDLYGRFRLLCPKLDNDDTENLEKSIRNELGSGSGMERPLLFDKDFFEAAKIRSNPQIQELLLDSKLRTMIPFLDRGVIGGDWLGARETASCTDSASCANKRVVFFGLKGGVGRTTALCMTARHFSRLGLKVLVVDVDLESPGLGSLLLPQSDLPSLGIIDWFMEDGLEQDTSEILDEVVATSSLAADFRGSIRVAPAFGRDEKGYIPKLSRVYADLARPGNQCHNSFADRFLRMLGEIEEKVRPDLVLLDSRAGLHDIAATLLVKVPNALRLLFAHNSPQTWAGYELLFRHWQAFPRNLANFRDGLQLVDAMMPETGREAHRESFVSSGYLLFNNTLYEDIEAGKEIGDAFNFQEDDSEAPHFGPAISWDRKFMEFNPNESGSSFHEEDLIRVVFGSLITCVAQRLGFDTSSTL